MILSCTSWGYRVGQARRPTQVVALHGNPLGDGRDTSLGEWVRTGYGGLFSGLYATGHAVSHPWMGGTWGGTVDPSGHGGNGPDIVDTIHPTGPVHLIGMSMGGHSAAVYATHNVGRVASLTLLAPAVDLLAVHDHLAGNPILFTIAREIRAARCGDPDAPHTDLIQALEDDGDDVASMAAALAPIADRIWVVIDVDDPLIPVDSVTGWATAVGVPDEQVVVLDSGAPNPHEVPYDPEVGWDDLTTLRQVTRWAA